MVPVVAVVAGVAKAVNHYRQGRDVRITKQLLRHMQAGRPLTTLSARQTYGVEDLPREIYRIRAKGYHVKQTEKTTLGKYTGIPQTTIEYRMEAI